ncbi:MAG: aminotransferase class I/II-fold pyridoxal phosphate-dependent enzyme, partial [Methanocorpusculum sp.]|nr:aminotransferase class I/II-fold pyridoxal phosphate-dependent enzyme [Methanocorpusculum sp.]
MPSEFPKKAIHGGKILEMRRRFKGSLLDVSASMNPFVPEFTCAYNHDDLAVYPDDSYTELKEKIARTFNRNVDEICVGNGSAEIIRVFCKVTDGKTCRIDMPTFGEYSLSARLAGKTVIQNAKADIRFICNPNNPTGILTPRDDMLNLVQEAEDTSSMLFVDEAFMELAEKDESISDVRSENLFVMRSITKCFTVPGLRFGFGFGEPKLIEKIETARTPWTVNAFAEKYAITAFDHYEELKESA